MKIVTSKVISLVLMCLFFITLTGCENDKWIDELSDKLVFQFSESNGQRVVAKQILDKKNSYLNQELFFEIRFYDSFDLKVLKDDFPQKRNDETIEEFELRMEDYRQSLSSVTKAYVESQMEDVEELFSQVNVLEYSFLPTTPYVGIRVSSLPIKFIKQVDSFIIDNDFVEVIFITPLANMAASEM